MKSKRERERERKKEFLIDRWNGGNK
jgi:hypothetical protein